jgi:hypothetical protein
VDIKNNRLCRHPGEIFSQISNISHSLANSLNIVSGPQEITIKFKKATVPARAVVASHVLAHLPCSRSILCQGFGVRWAAIARLVNS